jgi:UDP-glucose 4-epimerase
MTGQTGVSEQTASPMIWAGKNVLLTGGAGFIGSNLARRLVDLGAKVTCFDAYNPLGGANPFNLHGYEARLEILRGDMRDKEMLPRIVRDKDVLFNLAAQTSHVDSMTDPRTDLEINTIAQLDLVEACRNFAPGIRTVHISTRQIYGRPQYLPVDEKHPLSPPDVNGINKIAGESYHLLYGRIYGIDTTILRLTNTYGPRMRVCDARQMFLGLWINRACSKQPFEVWGGAQIRDLAFIDNVVDALIAAVGPKTIGQVFNIGGETVLTLEELAQRLIALRDGATYVVKEFPADRKGIDIGDYRADDSAFTAATGWTPKVSFEEGLRETLNFYRAHGQHYFKAMP